MSVQARIVPPMKTLPRPLFSRHESLPAGSMTPLHHHVWGQFSYAIHGVLNVQTASGNYLAPPHYAVWIPPGVEHQVLNSMPTEMRGLYVDATLSESLPAGCTVLEVTPLMRELICRFSLLPVEYPTNGVAARLAAVLVDELGALKPAIFSVPLPSDRRLQNICACLQKKPHDAKTLTEWAKVTGASERTLARLFVRETGLTFGAWRQRMRLVMSLEALERGESVSAIAFNVGYESLSAFIAAFRSTFGCTPGEFKVSGISR